MANSNTRQATGWAGWVYFAGFMMMVMGVLEMINGLTALLHDKFFLVRSSQLAVFDFTTWGWIHLLLGLVVLLAGTAVLSGHVWGRIVAVFLAMLNIFANFAFLSAYPIWSIIAIALNVLVIYALTVHGDEVRV